MKIKGIVLVVVGIVAFVSTASAGSQRIELFLGGVSRLSGYMNSCNGVKDGNVYLTRIGLNRVTHGEAPNQKALVVFEMPDIDSALAFCDELRQYSRTILCSHVERQGNEGGTAKFACTSYSVSTEAPYLSVAKPGEAPTSQTLNSCSVQRDQEAYVLTLVGSSGLHMTYRTKEFEFARSVCADLQSGLVEYAHIILKSANGVEIANLVVVYHTIE
jgi:hypothetical protein